MNNLTINDFKKITLAEAKEKYQIHLTNHFFADKFYEKNGNDTWYHFLVYDGNLIVNESWNSQTNQDYVLGSIVTGNVEVNGTLSAFTKIGERVSGGCDMWIMGNLNCKNLCLGKKGFYVVKGNVTVEHTMYLSYGPSFAIVFGDCKAGTLFLNNNQNSTFAGKLETRLLQFVPDAARLEKDGNSVHNDHIKNTLLEELFEEQIAEDEKEIELNNDKIVEYLIEGKSILKK